MEILVLQLENIWSELSKEQWQSPALPFD